LIFSLFEVTFPLYVYFLYGFKYSWFNCLTLVSVLFINLLSSLLLLEIPIFCILVYSSNIQLQYSAIVQILTYIDFEHSKPDLSSVDINKLMYYQAECLGQ